MQTATLQEFAGLDLRNSAEETSGAIDLLNVEFDQPGRVRSRDGYAKVTTSAGATRYDSVFAVASASTVSSSSKLAGTGSSDASIGTGAWTNPGNITADDGTYATHSANSHGGIHISQYLLANNFGFAIPGGSTINGVVVEWQYKTNSSTCSTNSLRLFKGGVVVGDDNATGTWSTTEVVESVGGASYLWGTTLTVADVNAANFGVGIAISGGPDFSITASVDYIRLTVYYTTNANLAVAGAAASRLDVIDTTGAVAATVATATDTQSTYVAFGSPATSAVYIANSGTTIRKLVGTTFSAPAGMPKCKCVALQSPDNRLVAANVNVIPTGAASTASTSLVHFSDAGAPETWSANNYVYLTPGDNEDIQGVCTWRNMVFVFKSSRFFVFYGNSTDSTGNPIFNFREVSGAGLASPRGLTTCQDGVFFYDRRGIYFTTGGPPQRVTDLIDPLFQGSADSYYQAGVVNPSAAAQVSMAWLKDRLYVGLPLGASTTNSHTLAFDPTIPQWTLWDIPMGAMAATSAIPEKLLFTYASGTNDIGQYARDAYTTDAGTAISWRYRTAFMDMGTHDAEKHWREVLVDGVGTVAVAKSVNEQVPVGATTSLALGATPTQLRDRRGARGRNLSLQFTGTSAATIKRVTVNWYGERASGLQATQ